MDSSFSIALFEGFWEITNFYTSYILYSFFQIKSTSLSLAYFSLHVKISHHKNVHFKKIPEGVMKIYIAAIFLLIFSFLGLTFKDLINDWVFGGNGGMWPMGIPLFFLLVSLSYLAINSLKSQLPTPGAKTCNHDYRSPSKNCPECQKRNPNLWK
jgi:hypothetical protein